MRPVGGSKILSASFTAMLALAFQALGEVREVFVLHPSGWYEGAFSESTVSRDEKWLFFTAMGRARIVEVQSGRDATEEELAGFDSVRSAAPFGAEGLALLGTRGGERGWFTPAPSGYVLSSLPPDALPRWNEEGHAAYFRRDEKRKVLHFRDAEYPVGGEGAGLSWLPGGRGVLALVWHPEGSVEVRAYALDGSARTLARGLDAPFFFTSIGLSADGGRVFLPLVSEAEPMAEARHDPSADRDLDIYSLDLDSGDISLVFEGAGDDLSPALAGKSLFWISNECVQQVAVFPIEGGAPRVLVEHGYLPRFRPDGRKLAFTVGDWRMADIPLNLDAMVIDIDGEARALSKPRGIVTGYHEDFTPAWSPDGKWLAYHSHRSPKAVSIFDERGSTDDIYLRRVDGLSPEIRLTDFGHETGSASWLPDSRRLVFDSQDIGITPAVTRTWVVEIDPDSGKAVSKKELLRPAGVRSLESVAFSPSGRELALLGEAENGKAIWVQDVEKGSLQRLAPYAASTHGGIDWAPDERTLIYSALGAEHMEIFSVTRNQGSWGEPRRVAAEADADLLQPQVSPDGRFIACARVKWTKRLMRKDVLE